MSTRNIRLGSMLTFNEEQEADIIALIDALNSSHKSGQFISNLFRIAVDCPEIIQRTQNGMALGETLKQLDASGYSTNRSMIFGKYAKDIAEMKEKVDSMYSMIFQMYMLAQMGKHLGLEEKSANSLRANFVIEKQLKELETKLGVRLKDDIFASNKLVNVENTASQVLEYIINTYSDILSEIKESLKETVVVTQQVAVDTQGSSNVQPVASEASGVTAMQSTGQVEQNISADNTDEADEADEIIDFGNSADFNALDDFFGA